MNKIIDYVLCGGPTAAILQENVLCHLKQGYYLYESPFASAYAHHQAVVKYFDENADIRIEK